VIFSLDIRRAKKGDCLLLHFGTQDQPGLAMIDGGPGGVYGPHLKPRLLEIKKARGLAGNQPLPVDLLMVSHVDDDHIRGILDLTREMRESPHAPLLRVVSFWHNSFDDLIGNDASELSGNVAAQFGAASLAGGLPADATLDSDEPEHVVIDTLKVLASIEQGHRLRGDAEALGFPRNPEFGGKLIAAARKAVKIGGSLTFTVAGPMTPELKALQKKHAEFLKKHKGKTPKAALAAYVDKSVPNLSSIVVLAKAGGKSMLLTGDARGDKILKGLELTGVLKPGKTMKVDLLKVPHHGSANNLETDFFERILADHYVFSGDGEHGNPERESMEMLFTARGKAPFTIHLTYPISEIDAARQEDWEKEQAKEKARKKKGGQKPVRENWSPTRHSLKAFFDRHPLANGQKLAISDANKPHVIDLLDRLGF
jgi:hypothetical protein